MKIEFLGAGDTFSKLDNFSNLILSAEGEKFTINFGSKITESLHAVDYPLNQISGSFITHLLNENTGGLEELAILSRLVFKTKPFIISTASILESLWNNSLKGGLEYLEENEGDTKLFELNDYFEPFVVEPNRWYIFPKLKKTRFKLLPTVSIKNKESYGILLESENKKSAFFSGNTVFDESYIQKYGKKATVIFQDCKLNQDFFPNAEIVHPSYEELKGLAPNLKEKMWLYQYDLDSIKPDHQKDNFAGFATKKTKINL